MLKKVDASLKVAFILLALGHWGHGYVIMVFEFDLSGCHVLTSLISYMILIPSSHSPNYIKLWDHAPPSKSLGISKILYSLFFNL